MGEWDLALNRLEKNAQIPIPSFFRYLSDVVRLVPEPPIAPFFANIYLPNEQSDPVSNPGLQTPTGERLTEYATIVYAIPLFFLQNFFLSFFLSWKCV